MIKRKDGTVHKLSLSSLPAFPPPRVRIIFEDEGNGMLGVGGGGGVSGYEEDGEDEEEEEEEEREEEEEEEGGEGKGFEGSLVGMREMTKGGEKRVFECRVEVEEGKVVGRKPGDSFGMFFFFFSLPPTRNTNPLSYHRNHLPKPRYGS